MFRTLTFLSLTLGAAPAWASEVGTCLTEAGVRVAPHSDMFHGAINETCSRSGLGVLAHQPTRLSVSATCDSCRENAADQDQR